MRLKIDGEITPERMKQVMEIALKELASMDPEAKFYGANLYLVPFDVEGERLTILNSRNQPLVLGISAPKGGVVRPALTAEAKQRRRAVREEEERREIRAAELRREEDAERQRRRQIQAVQAAKAQATFDALNTLTSHLIASEPKALIDGFNEAIRASWQVHQPRESQGARKGELRPVPIISTADGKLVLSTPAWKNARWLQNPIGTPRGVEIAPIWTFRAWTTALIGFLRVMEGLNGSLPEAITDGPLPVVESD